MSSDDNKCQVASTTPPTSVSQSPIVVQTSTMNDPQISEVPSPRTYPTFEPNTNPENILRGGFRPLAKQKWNIGEWLNYPPLTNEAYSLDTNAYYPRPSQHEAESEMPESASDLVGLGIEGLDLDGSPKVDDDVEPAREPANGKTKGEILADKIDFKRPSWVTRPVGSCFDILPPDEQKREFIELINKNKDGSGQLEPCFKCGEKHIIPGSPLTLGDRDKCYSALPDVCKSPEYLCSLSEHFRVLVSFLNDPEVLRHSE
jgi:hypothetical protein